MKRVSSDSPNNLGPILSLAQLAHLPARFDFCVHLSYTHVVRTSAPPTGDLAIFIFNFSSLQHLTSLRFICLKSVIIFLPRDFAGCKNCLRYFERLSSVSVPCQITDESLDLPQPCQEDST